MAHDDDENVDDSRAACASIESPFPCLQVDLSPDDLRETAYEIFLAAQEMQASMASPTKDSSAAPSPIKSGAVRRFKKALSMGKKKNSIKHLGAMELMRLQMEISEKSDARTKRALTKAQAARPSKNLLVPLELLQHTNSAEFIDFREYKRWQKRQIKVLEAGLLSSDKENAGHGSNKLKQALDDVSRNPHEAGKEAYQVLRNAAYQVAGNDVHWANSYPFNVYLYEMLLRSIFDSLEETALIEGLEEVMLFVKSTWNILGFNKMFHKICFVWVLFRQFVVTGNVEAELLKGAEMELREISNLGDLSDDYVTYDLLNSTLTYIQAWAEQRLIAYHTNFPDGCNGVLESLAGVAILAVQILHKIEFQEITIDPEDEHDMASNRASIYIQSSVRYAFDEMLTRRRTCNLEKLAKQTASLLLNEKETFSPVWKIWHPHPISVAAATLHSCYRAELRVYLSGVTEISSQAMEILQGAAELEKKLVQLDMDDKSVFDTRSAVIPPMTPFTLDADLRIPLRKWIQERLDQLEDWLDRNAQQEEWKPNGTRDHYAVSAVEMLHIVEEASDAFFSLPVSQHPELLLDIVNSIDSSLTQYINFCLSGCDDKNADAAAPDPVLRRQKEFAASLLGKVTEAWQSKQEALGFNKGKLQERAVVAAQVEELDESNFPSLEALCVRINSVTHVQAELEFLEKKFTFKWQEIPFTKESKQMKLEQTRGICSQAVEKLCDTAAYTVVSKNLRDVFWQNLYIPSVSKARIGPVIEGLESHLEIVARLVSGRLRNQVANYLMMAAFQGFLQVLADVKSTRIVNSSDLVALDEDLKALKDLFEADGDGLPEDLVDAASQPISEFLASIQVEPSSENSSRINFRGSKLEANLKLILRKPKMAAAPEKMGKMSSTLGYKCHAMASKLVKKTYFRRG